MFKAAYYALKERAERDPYRDVIELAYELADRTITHDVIKNVVAGALGRYPDVWVELKAPGTVIDVLVGESSVPVPIEVKADPESLVRGSGWRRQAYYAACAVGTDTVLLTNGFRWARVTVHDPFTVEVDEELESEPTKEGIEDAFRRLVRG